jgi:light-harvesting protein B-800-850 alpha chain
MNQGRIWCVVKPTVGLPLFLGSVAVISLTVHYSVMTHTTWVSGFFNGSAKAKAAQSQSLAPTADAKDSGFTISVSPSVAADGKGATTFVVTVSPKSGTSAPPVADSGGPRPPDKLVLAPTQLK